MTNPAQAMDTAPGRSSWAAALAAAVLDVAGFEAGRLHHLVHEQLARRAMSLIPPVQDEVMRGAISTLLRGLSVAQLALPAAAALFAIAGLRGRARWLAIPSLALALLLLWTGINIIE